VRYSGTPLPVSFDETYPHSVSMVEIGRHGDTPVVTPIEIINPRPLVTLPTQGTCSWEEAKELLRAFPDDIPAYIRLNVEIADFLPVEAKAEAVLITRDKQCRFCYIKATRTQESTAAERPMTIQEFQAEPPIEIARRYAEDTGIVFDEELQEMFRQVEQMVEEENRQ
jgi:exonuclease SbcD